MDLQRLFPNNPVCLQVDQPQRRIWRILNVSYQSLNYLRRWLITEVRSIAFNWVQIEFNNTRLNNNVVATRINLLPIEADPLKLEKFQEQDPRLCSSQTCLTFELDVQNTTRQIQNVLASQLQYQPSPGQENLFPTPPRIYSGDEILLYKLQPGQKIKLKAFAIQGIGKEHEKWSSVDAFHRLIPAQRVRTPSLTETLFQEYQRNLSSEDESVIERLMDDISEQNLSFPGRYLREQIFELPFEDLEGFISLLNIPRRDELTTRFLLADILDRLGFLQTTEDLGGNFNEVVDQLGCLKCESFPLRIQMTPGYNCYYFTIELTGGVTFPQLQEQLDTLFQWPENLVPVNSVETPVTVPYFGT